MKTDLRVDGANCSLCMNDVVDQLRQIDGVRSVNSSISRGCVAIDHDDLDPETLVSIVRSSLHGVAMSSNETVMSSIEPVVAFLHCTHRAEDDSPTAGQTQHRLETLTDALSRLRADGYRSDFFATDHGELACRGCDRSTDPAYVQVDHTVRFEGDTNPDDQDIVLAIECGCGCKGVYSAAYGPSTPPEDAAVLRRLARKPLT
jgi:copper chaperone CopZ